MSERFTVAEWLETPTDNGRIIGEVFLRTDNQREAEAEARRHVGAAVYEPATGHIYSPDAE